jgi:predicted DCC family thiol-disulfide oxidoreductase YuxK
LGTVSTSCTERSVGRGVAVPRYRDHMSGRAAVVLYDAGCGICTRLAVWLARRGIRVTPIRSIAGDRELRDLPPVQRDASLHVVDDRGRRLSGARGLPPILRALPGFGWTARIVEAAPAPFAWGYAVVARHRATLSRLFRLRACTAGARDAPWEGLAERASSPGCRRSP